MKKSICVFFSLILLTLCNHAQTVTDVDGNVYNTVTIGTQVWMKENLKAIHFSNGDTIPYDSPHDHEWLFLYTPAYCNYFDDTTYAAIYGRLYNWYVVNDSRNMCPIDWHVPSDSEWTILVDYLGGDSVAGGKMKETDTIHWWIPNVGATNSSGFTALPGGQVNSNDELFLNRRFNCYLWSSTGCDTCSCWYRQLLNFTSTIQRNPTLVSEGLSVRCLRNMPAKINAYDLDNTISISPNPAITNLTIQTPLTSTIEIFNLQGQCLKTLPNAQPTTTIDVSQLPSGIYFIKATTEKGTVVRKFIKQ